MSIPSLFSSLSSDFKIRLILKNIERMQPQNHSAGHRNCLKPGKGPLQVLDIDTQQDNQENKTATVTGVSGQQRGV